MNKISIPLTWLCLLLFIAPLNGLAKFPDETIVYIVRHAEKDTSNTKNNDPNLSKEGKVRAEALNDFLKAEKITAVYSTNFKRTIQTVAPVAQHNEVSINTYDAKDPSEVARIVKSQLANQKVLVAGHSNTILEIVKSFGVDPPADKLNDDDYDLIFQIRIDKNGSASLITKRFGKKHHSTEIPETELVH